MEKRSTRTTPEDPTVLNRPGWEGLHVWWLVDRGQTGASGIVFNITEFPPGKVHELHRHPNTEEALYVLRGSGLHMSEGEPVRQEEGEVVFIPRGEWHGFANDTGDPVTVLAVFGGIGSYDEAGYEVLEETDSNPQA
jgi:quercetin dioxygenase-like cupin family protein